VRKITFTGSDTVGRALAIECAKHLKPAVLELGGKSAAVVLADADIEHAAQTIVFGALLHSGQICMSTERVIVEKSVAGKLRDAIKALVERVPVAPEEGEGAPVKHVAPLFKEQAAENVIKAIKEAQSQGATVLVGNSERQGASIRPHLLTNVPLGSTLWKRETFGPGSYLRYFLLSVHQLKHC
jgi:acyl-CoA reductase-like NAD-dependent aldehyde dehydrogenase